MANSLGGRDSPQDFNPVIAVSDPYWPRGELRRSNSAGFGRSAVTWYSRQSAERLAHTVLALNPPLHFEFIIEPSTTLPTRPIEPRSGHGIGTRMATE